MSELRHRLKTLRGFVNRRAERHRDFISPARMSVEESNHAFFDREGRIDECRILIAEIDRMLTFKATGRPLTKGANEL